MANPEWAKLRVLQIACAIINYTSSFIPNTQLNLEWETGANLIIPFKWHQFHPHTQCSNTNTHKKWHDLCDWIRIDAAQNPPLCTGSAQHYREKQNTIQQHFRVIPSSWTAHRRLNYRAGRCAIEEKKNWFKINEMFFATLELFLLFSMSTYLCVCVWCNKTSMSDRRIAIIDWTLISE
jgi:hypothetical protein